jgi:hypothetical protein
MQELLRRLLAAGALGLAAQAAHADVLDFEDLSGTQYFGASYHGFNFGNLDPATNDWYWSDIVAAPFTARSGSTSVATDFLLYANLPFEAASGISAATPFVFSGAWFAGEALNADGSAARVQFQLYRQGALVFTSATSAALSDAPQFLASGYGGVIDTVVVTGPQGYFVMDDFIYAPVPEPSAALLAVVGLPLLGAALRRKRARAMQAHQTQGEQA